MKKLLHLFSFGKQTSTTAVNDLSSPDVEFVKNYPILYFPNQVDVILKLVRKNGFFYTFKSVRKNDKKCIFELYTTKSLPNEFNAIKRVDVNLKIFIKDYKTNSKELVLDHAIKTTFESSNLSESEILSKIKTIIEVIGLNAFIENHRIAWDV